MPEDVDQCFRQTSSYLGQINLIAQFEFQSWLHFSGRGNANFLYMICIINCCKLLESENCLYGVSFITNYRELKAMSSASAVAVPKVIMSLRNIRLSSKARPQGPAKAVKTFSGVKMWVLIFQMCPKLQKFPKTWELLAKSAVDRSQNHLNQRRERSLKMIKWL